METAIQKVIDKVNNIAGTTVDKDNLLHFLHYHLEKEKTSMQILLDELQEYEKQMFEDGNTKEVYCTQRFISRVSELIGK